MTDTETLTLIWMAILVLFALLVVVASAITGIYKDLRQLQDHASDPSCHVSDYDA